MGTQGYEKWRRAIIQQKMQGGGDVLPWADRMAGAERMLKSDLRAHTVAQAPPTSYLAP